MGAAPGSARSSSSSGVLNRDRVHRDHVQGQGGSRPSFLLGAWKSGRLGYSGRSKRNGWWLFKSIHALLSVCTFFVLQLARQLDLPFSSQPMRSWEICTHGAWSSGWPSHFSRAMWSPAREISPMRAPAQGRAQCNDPTTHQQVLLRHAIFRTLFFPPRCVKRFDRLDGCLVRTIVKRCWWRFHRYQDGPRRDVEKTCAWKRRIRNGKKIGPSFRGGDNPLLARITPTMQRFSPRPGLAPTAQGGNRRGRPSQGCRALHLPRL